MQLKPVNEKFLVADQITLDDLNTIAAQGIRTLICNRPDSELTDQPMFAEVSERARQLGITAHYLPVVHATINSGDVRKFTALLQTADEPVLAFCRSGLRSMTLWSLSRMQQGEDTTTVVSQAKNSGFDFSNMPSAFAKVVAELK
jgi:sulfide:quinone oxidoreductase